MLIGILADSHGYPDRLSKGIEVLKGLGAETLIHLGDVTDTLKPETVDECVGLLIDNGVQGVMGNHEYSLVTHHFKRYPERFSGRTKKYVRSLPYKLEMCGVCFSHFSPDEGVHGLYAHTDEGSYVRILRNSCRSIIINGHSHDPRIYRQVNGLVEDVGFDRQGSFILKSEERYVLTCGALEDWYCALFDSEGLSFEVISVEA